MSYQYQHQGDTLFVAVTEFESLGALETDEHYFVIDYKVVEWVDSHGHRHYGDYPHMTATLDDAIKDHVKYEHYTYTTDEERF